MCFNKKLTLFLYIKGLFTLTKICLHLLNTKTLKKSLRLAFFQKIFLFSLFSQHIQPDIISTPLKNKNLTF